MIREMRGRGIKRAARVWLQDGAWGESEKENESGGVAGDLGGDDGTLLKVSESESESAHDLRRCEMGIAAASVWL